MLSVHCLEEVSRLWENEEELKQDLDDAYLNRDEGWNVQCNKTARWLDFTGWSTREERNADREIWISVENPLGGFSSTLYTCEKTS